jgi:hypothetical protein
MKKPIAAILIFLFIVLACIYLLIPSKILIQQTLTIPTNARGFQRTFLEDRIWEQWWPEGKIKDTAGMKQTGFLLNSRKYTIVEKRMSSIILCADHADSAKAVLYFISPRPDSVKLVLEAEVATSAMPAERVRKYFQSKQLENDLKTLLNKIRTFYTNEDNIYGTHIEKSLVVDSILIFTNAISEGPPSTKFIYALVDSLKEYAASQSAKETGFPMLNISTTDSINYLTKVAIPVNKRLPSSGNISHRWMLGGGTILITEVKGGPASITKAFEEITHYAHDNQRVAPAIPFQSLITDRRKEPDTSRWITRIYYPVM